MSENENRVTVAAVQAAPVYLDLAATVEKTCRLIEQAAATGARFIVFPECFISGFPHWYSFFIAGEARSREFAQRMFESAVEVPSPAIDRLAAAARRANAWVAVGMNERAPGSWGTLYNSLLFFDPAGAIVAHRRKLVPTSTERLVHAGADRPGLTVVETPFGGFGGLMCGENTNPLAKFTLLRLGEVLHAAAWPAFPLDTERFQKQWIDIRTRSHAFEGKTFVISSTGVFSDEMKDVLGLTSAERARFRGDGGHSAIIDPNGQFVAGPLEDGEGIVSAEIDLGEIIRGRQFQDVTGHYNRFDVFDLRVNDAPFQPAVTTEPELVPVERQASS